MSFTISDDNRRGKGIGKSRYGPRVDITRLNKESSKKTIRTPNEIALNKLLDILKVLNIPEESRDKYAAIVKDSDQLRFMNMPVLAHVLLYLASIEFNVTPENYNEDKLRPFVDKLLYDVKDVATDEKEIMKLRMYATFFRYSEYVMNRLNRPIQ